MPDKKRFYTFGKYKHQLLHKLLIMKRGFFFIILFSLVSSISGQWNDNYNIEHKCSHISERREIMSLEHLYNWQSELLDDYDVKFYHLDLEVSSSSTYISGNVTIKADAVVQIDTIAFELIPVYTIDSILINGSNYTNDTIIYGDNIMVPVSIIDSNTAFSVQVFYNGDPGSTTGLSSFTSAFSEKYQKHVTWTLSEPFGAKRWFPVKQDLEDKADSCWVFLTTDSSNMAGSQGILTNTLDIGNGKTRYEWKSKYPIAYYLISFAVSDYQEYNIYAYPDQMNGDSILIQNFIYDHPDCLSDYKTGIDATSEMIELFSELYILYPFHEEKYGHCLTQLGGGMEHQTMTTINSFGFGLVAHELGHMWFGDNVTCATWSDIWINEGFATYSNYLAEEFIHGWESGKAFISSKQNNAMSQPGGSTYVPEDQISEDMGDQWRIFSGRLSYNKGAAIVHTLRHEIQDDDMFFDVMETFQVEFTDSTATGDDFKTVAEDVTGMDFDQFFDQWYYGQGYPTYDIEYYMLSDTLHLTITQTSSTTATTLFEMLMDYKLVFNDGTDTTVQFTQTDNINNFSVYAGKEVTNIIVDPEDWTMEKVGSISVTVEEKESPVYFSIGPNPVSLYLNIYFLNPSNKQKEIRVTDLSGKTLSLQNSNQKHIHYNTSNLSKGVYFVHITDGQYNFTRKFVK